MFQLSLVASVAGEILDLYMVIGFRFAFSFAHGIPICSQMAPSRARTKGVYLRDRFINLSLCFWGTFLCNSKIELYICINF